MKTDKITGLEQEVSEHPTYGKFFIFLSGDNLTIMSELDCTYEYIAANCHTYTLKIPSEIIGEYTVGKETYAGDSNGYSSSTFDQDTKIKILGKNTTERTCNVRGIEYSPYNVYYTADSTEFNKISRYICFESEDEAINKGYKIAANN